jgi:hypothetical protein
MTEQLIEQVLEGKHPRDVVDNLIVEVKKKSKKISREDLIAQKRKSIGGQSEIIVKGISDEIDICQLCGKHPLKRTIVLEIDNEIVYYGTTCASKLLGMKKNYTAASAKRLVNDYKEKVKDDKREAEAIKLAQENADKLGEVIYLLRSRGSYGYSFSYSSVREVAYLQNSHLYRGDSHVATLYPKKVKP